MSKFTKKAIEDAFIELSNTIPIEKITVTAVTNACGINRNTFYYHYQDIYSLLEEILTVRAKRLFTVEDVKNPDSWKSALRLIGEYGRKNKGFIKNAYNSMGRDAFEDYIADIAYQSLYPIFHEGILPTMTQKGKTISERNLNQLVGFYSLLFANATVGWLRGKLGDSVEVMEKAIVMLDGVIIQMMENLAE
ncbi:MAG: TetR/AcrR family transcriptional regulator [Lachnospiraceae bacterium]